VVYADPLEYDFSLVTNFQQFLAKVATIPGATTTMTGWNNDFGGAHLDPGNGTITIPLPSTHNKFTLDVWEVAGLHWWIPSAYIEVVLNPPSAAWQGWTISDSNPRQIVSNYSVGQSLIIREIGSGIVHKSLKLKLEHVPTGTSQ
jgi:hypothetical protein